MSNPRICYELEMLPTICKLSEKSLKLQKSILIWRKQRRYLKRYRRYNFTSSSLYRDIVLSVFSIDERWGFQLQHRNLMKRIPFSLLSNYIVEFPILYLSFEERMQPIENFITSLKMHFPNEFCKKCNAIQLKIIANSIIWHGFFPSARKVLENSLPLNVSSNIYLMYTVFVIHRFLALC